MDSRSIFRHPTARMMAGDAGTRGYGALDTPGPQGGRHFDRNSLEIPATKNPVRTSRRPVPQSDTGVPGEHPQAFGRTLVKELGNLTPYLRYKGCSWQHEPQRIGTSDCLSKTQDAANSQEDV
jgi:hypothetical protein